MSNSSTTYSNSARSTDLLELAKEHHAKLVFVLLGLLGAQLIYGLVRRSIAFRELNGPGSGSILWGNERLLSSVERSDELLSAYGSVCKLKSILGEDRLWIADPQAMGIVLFNAHNHFNEPEMSIWLRLTMSSTVVSNNFKLRLPHKTPKFTVLAYQLVGSLVRQVQESGTKSGIVDMNFWVSKTSMELISQEEVGFSLGTVPSTDIIYSHAMNQLFPMASMQLIEENIISQVNGIVFGGHDIARALARTLHLLAQHPDIQDQLREEVRGIRRQFGADLEYDRLNSLTFLDAVCRESLRLWPPVECVKCVAGTDWSLPLQYPVKTKNGDSVITELYVPTGTHIYLSIEAANRDKQTWGEDADKFNPSRWLKPPPVYPLEAQEPGAYMRMITPWNGPSADLGLKLAQFELKAVLSTLISSFNFEPGDSEVTWIANPMVKPYLKGADGTIDATRGPALPMKVTILERLS